MIAAPRRSSRGCYFGLPDVDPWDESRDARTYAGPHPVVAHPPCQRGGKYWHGSTCKPHQYKLGADGGCFVAALAAVRRRPALRWGKGPQRLHPVAVERYGYEKARRIGMMAMVGGKDKTRIRIREATPPEFRDLLLAIARTANGLAAP